MKPYMGGSIIQHWLPQIFDPNPSCLKQDKNKCKDVCFVPSNRNGETTAQNYLVTKPSLLKSEITLTCTSNKQK